VGQKLAQNVISLAFGTLALPLTGNGCTSLCNCLVDTKKVIHDFVGMAWAKSWRKMSFRLLLAHSHCP
jgi:hypothetical protein